MQSSRKELSDKSLLLARKYKGEQKLARSFAHFLVHWQVSHMISGYSCSIQEIINVFDDLTVSLEAQDRTSDLLSTYQQAVEILPKNEDITFRYATALFKVGKNGEAMNLLSQCETLKCKELLDTIKSYSLDRWHFAMLNDRDRNDAFRKILLKTVSSQDIVLDIGAGTGLLSLFASHQRAKKVIACEASKEMFDVAKDIIQANGANIDLKNCLSTQLVLEERADVLVTETFDAGLLGEHVLAILDHAWDKLLHDKSRVIPGKARIYTCLANVETISPNNNFGSLNLEAIQVTPEEREPYDCHNLEPEQLASQRQFLMEIDFNDKKQVRDLLKTGVKIKQQFNSGDLEYNCAALWFELIFDDEIKISTEPKKDFCCWNQAIYPLKKSQESQVELEFSIKGHIELIKNEATSLRMPNEMCKFLRYAKNSTDPYPKVETILDFNDVPLKSLDMLRRQKATKLTMFMWTDDAKAKVDLVTEIANQNNIDLSRIDGISLIQPPDDLYDLVAFDPVLPSGRLNSKVLQQLSNCTKPNVAFSPQKLTLWIALVESEELVKMHRMPNNDSVFDLKICDGLNVFSINHVQSLPKGLKYKILSQSINVHSFDFNEPLESTKDELEISIEQSGTIHAILYWFDIDTESTLKSPLYDQAAILLPQPMKVDHLKDDYLSVEVNFEDYLLDLKLT